MIKNLLNKNHLIDQISLTHLVAGCRKKERRYQKEFYRRYYCYLNSVCARYVDNPAASSQLINQTFFQAFENLHSYSFSRPVKLWLKEFIIINVISYLSNDLAGSANEAITDHFDVEEPGLNPNLSYTAALTMIRQLPVKSRVIYNLFAIDSFSKEDITGFTGFSPSDVEHLLRTARFQLTQFLIELA